LLETNDAQITRIVQKSESAIDTMQRTMDTADKFLNDPKIRGNLEKSIEMFPETLTELRDSITTAKETMNGFQRSIKLVESNLENMEGLTKPLGERGEVLVERLISGSERFDGILKEMEEFSRKLNDSEGSFSQFLNNPDLYNEMVQAAENVSDLTREMRPIIRDSRIVTDRLARHGLRGALQKTSGAK
jgi:phospholipid/cholesterol/gamma-HCH transport system substrate-binding protein